MRRERSSKAAISFAVARVVEGIYPGGYPSGPQFVEHEGLATSPLETKYVRNKKEPRFLDCTALLRPCGPSNF